MTDHEILLGLLEEKRRNDRQRMIERIIALVIIAALVIALIAINSKVTHAMQQIQSNIDRINTATQEITTFFAGFKEAGYENVEQALEELHKATSKINTFFDAIGEHGMQNIEQGMDTLNDAKDWLFNLFGEK